MVFVIAEIGVNWDGNFDLVHDMITNAKSIGCNAVKFQSFNEDIVKDHPEGLRLLQSSISPKNIEQINKICYENNIEWFCTPMYPEAVDFLDPFVKRYKIRELDGRILFQNKITPLLEKVLKTGKEVLISSQKSPKNTQYFEGKKIKWFYCIPKYPCELNDLDFTQLNYFDGYSNHCLDIIAPLSAVILGAKIIEIHVTADKSSNFIDNPVSFDYKQLSELVKLVRSAEKIHR